MVEGADGRVDVAGIIATHGKLKRAREFGDMMIRISAMKEGQLFLAIQKKWKLAIGYGEWQPWCKVCLLYTSPSPRD